MDQRVLRSATGAGTDVPLVVDLDGTLIATDSLHEGILAVVAGRPLSLFALPGWLQQGKAAFKDRIAAEAALDAASLPIRPGSPGTARPPNMRGRAQDRSRHRRQPPLGRGGRR